MLELTDGIVIRNQEFQDFDNIVTIYSKQFGKFSFISLGTRKPNSKNKPVIQLFSQAEFEVFKSTQNKLSKLKKGSLQTSHYNLAQNYFNYLLSSVVVDFVNYVVPVNSSNPVLYTWLSAVLDLIEQDNYPVKNCAFFLYKCLKFYDLSFELDKCTFCNKKVTDKRFFVEQKFGIICSSCYLIYLQTNNWTIIDSPKYLQMLTEIWDQDFLELKNYNAEISLVIILLKHILTFYQERLNFKILSFKTLKNSKIML